MNPLENVKKMRLEVEKCIGDHQKALNNALEIGDRAEAMKQSLIRKHLIDLNKNLIDQEMELTGKDIRYGKHHSEIELEECDNDDAAKPDKTFYSTQYDILKEIINGRKIQKNIIYGHFGHPEEEYTGIMKEFLNSIYGSNEKEDVSKDLNNLNGNNIFSARKVILDESNKEEKECNRKTCVGCFNKCELGTEEVKRPNSAEYLLWLLSPNEKEYILSMKNMFRCDIKEIVVNHIEEFMEATKLVDISIPMKDKPGYVTHYNTIVLSKSSQFTQRQASYVYPLNLTGSITSIDEGSLTFNDNEGIYFQLAIQPVIEDREFVNNVVELILFDGRK